jgi:hypothetical protein
MKRLAKRTSKRTENISPRARRRACLQRLLNMMAPLKAFAVAVPDKRDLVVLHPLPLGSKSSKDEELSCNKQCAMQIMSSFELGGHHGATAAIGRKRQKHGEELRAATRDHLRSITSQVAAPLPDVML